MGDKRKILMVCKESYTYPMNFVNDELQNRGYDVDALFIHYTESVLNNHSYRSFCERNRMVNTYSFDDAIMTYWDTYHYVSDMIDISYLKSIEDKYCVDLPFGLLMMSSQMFTTPYHSRFYFMDLTENEKLYWLQLVFKQVENILDDVKPERIIDIDNSELGRSVLYVVAKAKGITYATLESSRFESFWLPTYTLGRTTDSYFMEAYESAIKQGSLDQTYISKVQDFREKDQIMLDDYKYNNTSKNNTLPFMQDIKNLAGIYKSLFVQWIDNRNIFHVFKRVPLIASLWDSIFFFLLWFLRQRYMFSSFFPYFEKPSSSETYVYFPLHLIPESTTLIKSPFYPNEIAVIEAVSKALPMGWKLYVKEHGAMIGERPIEFYKRLKRLSNVKMVELNYYDDPKPWILNAQGVITLTGSSAFEAAMLGKPSLIFGNAYFEVIDGVEKVNSFLELPEKIKAMKHGSLDNLESCAAYIQIITKLGKYIPLTECLVESNKAIQTSSELPDNMKETIVDMVDILLANYEDA